MSLTVVNDHVLFPHRANWATDPEWTRTWQSKITTGLKGPESRSAMRATPRVSLKWEPSIRNLQEQNQLDDRIRAALKSGKACCPFWGRASLLQLACTSTTATLQSTPWPWAIGDSIFFLDQATREWNVRSLTNVSGSVLTLNTAVSRTWLANTPVWPLLFGKLDEATMAAETNHFSRCPIAIVETSPAGAGETVGEYTPPDPDPDLGIGDMEIGDSFLVR